MIQKQKKNKHRAFERLSINYRILESFLVILCIFAFYLIIALFSFNHSDLTWSQETWYEPTHNLCGKVGEQFASTLFFTFGILAYALPAIMLVFCYSIFSKRNRYNYANLFSLSIQIIGSLMLLLTSCGIVDLSISDLYYFPSGGIVGRMLRNAILPLFNNVGATLLLLCIWASGFILFTGLSLISISEKIGKAVLECITFVFARSLRKNKIKQNKHNSSKLSIADYQKNNQAMPIKNDLKTLTPTLKINAISQNTHIRDQSRFKLHDTYTKSHTLTTKGDKIQSHNWLLNTNAQHTSYNPKKKQIISKNKLSHHKSARIPIQSKFSPRSIVVPLQKKQKETSKSAEFPAVNIGNCKTIAQQPKTSLINKNPKIKVAYLNKRAHWDKEQYLIKNISQQQKQDNLSIKPKNHNNHLLNENSPLFIKHNNNFVLEKKIKSAKNDDNDTQTTNSLVIDKTNFAMPKAEFTISKCDEHKQPIAHTINKNNELENDSPQKSHNMLQRSNLFSKSMSQKSMITDPMHPLLIRQKQLRKEKSILLPTIDLLKVPLHKKNIADMSVLKQMARLVETRLADYHIKSEVVYISPGPVITRFELDLAPGVKAARISNLSRDLARSLSVMTVRVVEVIPGKPYVGLELPNKQRRIVYLREVIDCKKFLDTTSPLAFALGKDISGQPVIADLGKMPHLLVAGTTGSGKSVGVNAMILSILYKATPKEVRFIMIDLKMLELSVYEGIPHLLTKVVTDTKRAIDVLHWCVKEMERRYKLMSALFVRNLTGYNKRIEQANAIGMPVLDPFWRSNDGIVNKPPALEKLPYIVVIVDEFADLMVVVSKKVEELIIRLTQKARAAGIHLVLTTQRPSVDVVTGLIKANIPTRIAFTVPSKIDSRTILDQSGAESLLGMGDMLYLSPNSRSPIRVHGAFVHDEEIYAIVHNWKTREKSQYFSKITSIDNENEDFSKNDNEEFDPLFKQAVIFVVDKRRASISSLKRQFSIGHNRAARIIKQMELQGIISSSRNNSNR